MTSLKTSLKTLTVAALAAAAIVATAAPSQAIPRHFPPNTISYLGNQFGHGITCLVCRLPPRLPLPIWGQPSHGYGSHWGQWYHWHPAVYGGAPVAAVAVAGAVTDAPQAPNCLTKQNLPNGAVLFEDVCTHQIAIAPPPSMSAR